MKKNLLLFTTLILLLSNEILAQSQFWGTTQSGGANNFGSIYTIGNGDSITIVYDFLGSLNGKYPFGPLIPGDNGFIYGIAHGAGFYNHGIIFKFDILTHILTSVHAFNDTAGAYPGFMYKASDGNIYGSTSEGGTFNSGVIFKFNPITEVYTVLHNFDAGSSGGIWELINDKLYGVCPFAGNNYLGLIFSFDISSNVYTVIHYSDSLSGFKHGSLFYVGGGLLFGFNSNNSFFPDSTTVDFGVLFSYNLNTNVKTVLHQCDPFEGFLGCRAVLASDGKVYGTFLYGGPDYDLIWPNELGLGVLFSYDLNTNVFTVLHNLDFNTGINPQSGITQASNGLLYFVSDDPSKVLSYDITSNVLSIVDDFPEQHSLPSSTLLETESVTKLSHKNEMSVISVYPNPAKDYIIFDNSDQATKATCTDILGKEIEQIQLASFGKTRLDVSAYPHVFFVKDNQGQVIKVLRSN